VDWVAAGKLGPVVDQLSCGSCWAFATAANVEALTAIRSGAPPVPLAPQQALDCAGQSGCAGGSITGCFDWAASLASGWCASGAYPYTGAQGGCRGCAGVSRIAGWAAVAANNDAALAAAVASGPVTVAVDASSSAWQLYRGGVLSGACGASLNHAVLVVGYGVDDASGVPFWRIRNQWGTGWGEEGYARLARGGSFNAGAGVCGILSEPVVPRA